MGTLGRTTRNGTKPAARRVEPRARSHPAIAKLADALKENKETLEQQAATADILRALSRSSSDPQPVFEAIVEHAHRLCGAVFSILYRYDGNVMTVVADRVNAKASRILRTLYPAPPRLDHIVGRALLEGRVMHSADVPNDPRFRANRNAFMKAMPFRAGLEVPLLRNGVVVGAIAVGRVEAKAFTKKEIDLLKTFADQAVIAIENVRLFNETKEALEQQTATSEILGVISNSPTEIQPVLDAVAATAARLCEARDAIIQLREGDVLRFAAHYGTIPNLPQGGMRAISRHTVTGRAVLEGRQIHVHDLQAEKKEFPEGSAAAKEFGYRTMLVTPLMREGKAIGTILIRRTDVRPFSDKHLALVRTFADQAVIAIENVRLFNETKEALEHQKASADILRVVAGSIENTEPVFEAITRAGMRLIPGSRVALILVREDQLHYVSHSGIADQRRSELAKLFPVPLDRQTVAGTAILDKRMIHIPDVLADCEDFPVTRKVFSKISGFRAMLAVPLVRNREAIGALAVSRETPGPFTDKQLALGKTFADQAVIAIQNARMFRQIQDRNAELKQALDFQGASGEILASISSSMADTQPVFDAIVESTRRLFNTRYAVVSLIRENRLELVAASGDETYLKHVREAYPWPLAGEDGMVAARAFGNGQVVQICPILGNPDAPARMQRLAKASGYNATLLAPMMLEGVAIGLIVTSRSQAIRFDEKQVALIKVFADQAVIAIENARLFNETKESLERQTATSEVLRVISGSPTDVQPVFQTIAERAATLCGAKIGVVTRFDGELVHMEAFHGASPEATEAIRAIYPLKPGSDTATARAIRDRVPAQIADVAADPAYAQKDAARQAGFRSNLAVPMLLRDGQVIGAIAVARVEAGPFPQKQVELLKTFADQAVIAIENVRLFNETTEALERQTATGEILRVIASTPADAQPVFDAIAQSALRVFDVSHIGLTVLEGDSIRSKATAGSADPRGEFLIPLNRNSTAGRCMLDRAVINIGDTEAPDAPSFARDSGRVVGFRAIAAAPMLREGIAIGSVHMMRKSPGPFGDAQIDLLKSFADQAVIAIENARLFNETKEALEQQTATAEILKVISGSPTNTQPVFQAIAERAGRICEASDARIFLVEGSQLRHVAGFGDLPASPIGAFRPIDRGLVMGRSVIEGQPLQVEDVQAVSAEYPLSLRQLGHRTVLSVPLMRESKALGAILLRRLEVRPFSEKQIALLKTFADQAAIAIENVRLFNETKESLGQQTAISEVLRVISDSPTDVRPVLDAVAARAARICEAFDATIFLREGNDIRHVAHFGDIPPGTGLEVGKSVPLGRDMAVGRAIIDGTPVHIKDLTALPPDEWRRALEMQKSSKHRTMLAVPLMREHRALGAINLRRMEVRPFTEKQMALLKTFADQAAIAIENVRLFNETKEALDRQTATADILRVIGKSMTDAQPVFDAIVKNCSVLFPESRVLLRLVEDGQLHAKASVGESGVPAPIDRNSGAGACVLDRRTVHFPDLLEAAREYPSVRDRGLKLGYRSGIYSPLMCGDEAIGTISVLRRAPGGFNDKEIKLLGMFADQAVIAIENVRLFNETKEALERQTATADILKVISGSPTDIQPVLHAVAESAARLCDASDVVIRRVDGQIMRVVEHIGEIELPPETLAMPIAAASTSGRAILECKTIHIPDVTAPEARAEYPAGAFLFQRGSGYHSLLIVPMVREGNAIGTIIVRRKEKRPFSEQQIKLLQTFADQAVIAIENIRLFNETKEALERQTATSNVLRVISGSPTDVQPVFDTIVRSAVSLCGGLFGAVFRFDGELVHFVAGHGFSPEGWKNLREKYPVKAGDPSVISGRVIQSRQMEHIDDVLADPHYDQNHASIGGWRRMLGVPMLRDGVPLGVIVVAWADPGSTPQHQRELLGTFADQAVIAIENVRLFNETKEALEQQTAISEVLRVISSSPADVRPVLDAVTARAAKICDAMDANLFLVEGNQMRRAARYGGMAVSVEIGGVLPLDRGAVSGRAVIDRAVVHIEDLQAVSRDEFPVSRGIQDRIGHRTMLAVPLLRENAALGAIVLRRMEVRRFTEKQIALLQTFADQAAIAIENVRLFAETKEALEQQTATADILKVISSSTTDTQPVFEAIVQSAARLFSPCNIALVMREGDVMQRKATAGPQASQTARDNLAKIYPLPFDPERSLAARVIAERRILEILDTEAPEVPDFVRSVARAVGYRAVTAVPLVREGHGIGAIGLSHPAPGFRLTAKQLALVQTFADQAVIAIENVRLFKELQARTEALTKSVGQLTALGEVGQAITSTLDLEMVLKTIVSHAVHLTGVDGGSIYEYDERSEVFTLQAAENMPEKMVEDVRKTPVRKGDGAIGRSAITLEPVQVADILDETYRGTRKELLVRAGVRAILAVPLLRENHLLGAILVNRKTPGPFAPEVIELLKTFATQSALAIQNARLFREIAEKGKQLEVASRHKSDFLASMSHELRTPLNALLGFNEMILGDIYGEVPGDMKPPLAQMQSSGKHLLRLINNVLDLAKIEAGRMELALSDYSVHDTVESVRSTLHPLAADKGLELVAAVEAEVPLAYGDPGRITQCLMNLAGNSLKFTKAGKVEISAALNDGWLRYRVADTGIGIPPEKLASLFTEFKQTDATIASEYGGTGLGLSISKQFVELHGGRIWVESEPGKGSVFTFEIPLRAKTA